MPDNSGEPTRKRRRKACQNCRLRKTKCDSERPVCSLCRLAGSACEYLDEDEHRHEELTVGSATELLSRRLDVIQGLLEEHLTQRQAPNSHGAVQNNGATPGANLTKDFLQIPAAKTSADCILSWPIFRDRYSVNVLNDGLFKLDLEGGQEEPPIDLAPIPDGSDVPVLVNSFLENVHTKNPVLDMDLLLKHGQRIATTGFDWGPYSCLVLLACALGSVAVPFAVATAMRNNGLGFHGHDVRHDPKVEQGDLYFHHACRRLGTLRATTLGVQCHFFAGVYLMYTLRPLRSWSHFMNASTLYRLYEKIKHGSSTRAPVSVDSFTTKLSPELARENRLEQSLYWTCFKSESEFRVELPLPLTEISSHHHPQMFPTPSTKPAQSLLARLKLDIERLEANSPTLGSPLTQPSPGQMSQMFVDTAWNQDESWYYHLTEIALRRIGNRIVNTFFRDEPSSWMNIRPLLRIALEYDAQVSSWSANLPPAMQHWESTSSIRAPAPAPLESMSSDYVSQELSWAIDNRLLEVRSWLYRPFLFYLIHHQHTEHTCQICTVPECPEKMPHPSNLMDSTNSSVYLQTEGAALRKLISAGIECNLTIVRNRSLQHRHHGLWFDLRSLMCASLILLAAVESGYEAWISGGAEILWGPDFEGPGTEIEGEIGNVLAQFTHWSKECPDLLLLHRVLEDTTRHIHSKRDRKRLTLQP